LRAGGHGHFRRKGKALTTEDTKDTEERETGLVISIRETPAGVTFSIKVHPRAKKNGITGELGDALKIDLTAPPVDSKANEACIEFFANLLKVPRSSVTIAAGQARRNKVIRVVGLTAVELQKRLHLGSPA
jgi:uncharacterized protein (TIGR00251 family)